MNRLETRELAYFVAVARERHFGRAAQALGIAQPPLSRAIQQLERRLGVPLLVRGSRGVSLTPAGEVLLREGDHALAAVDAAARRTQRAGREEPRLVVVMKPGGDSGLLPDTLAAYATSPDAVPVEPLVCGIGEQARLLRDGSADVGLLQAPYDDPTGLDSVELLEERQILVVDRSHRLAGRTEVSVADLDDERLPRWPHQPPPDDAAHRPLVHDAGQLMQLVALGDVVVVLPESARDHLRQDLVAVPVVDAPTTRVLLAWPPDTRGRALSAFVRAAVEVADRRRQAGVAG
ncbi:LysR family transcriptional regulator [Actinopolymorpha pittospori]|uniref:DNA-binding transcriptional LysR family regulator n=1 Tax=Actinopolymorpha pittospori TaxID=648752 RepID=A0A927MPM9_9ACTN|nr:LysR family transcriptional regulator [Actinopolymorpha pittospori]MBE1604565.1 DNA-binding transcriptional LysR family regulator [Actinopolymorpha pittospori]